MTKHPATEKGSVMPASALLDVLDNAAVVCDCGHNTTDHGSNGCCSFEQVCGTCPCRSFRKPVTAGDMLAVMWELPAELFENVLVTVENDPSTYGLHISFDGRDHLSRAAWGYVTHSAGLFSFMGWNEDGRAGDVWTTKASSNPLDTVPQILAHFLGA